LKISKYSKHKISDLSYGIIRVAMFARSVIHDPEIILLDEPTSNLDPLYSEIIWNYIINVNKNKTVFYTTHNFKEAQEYSDRIIVLFNGTIKYNGTFENLVKNTFGLTRFIITYKERVPEHINKRISLNPNIVRPVIVENQLKFYSTDKTEYFNILKESLDSDIIDADSSKCTLEDIFKGIDSGETS
jgi:ABC-2 type transport system ATP-binding protein